MNTEPVTTSGATISRDKKYRFTLWRIWDLKQPRVLFILLNPSTANGKQDDPTIRKLIMFSKIWDYGGIIVVNLYPYRSTDPSLIPFNERVPNKENNEIIDTLIMDNRIGLIVCGWGNHGSMTPHLQYWVDKGVNLYCLGITNKGQPKHPLYIPYDQPLILFK